MRVFIIYFFFARSVKLNYETIHKLPFQSHFFHAALLFINSLLFYIQKGWMRLFYNSYHTIRKKENEQKGRRKWQKVFWDQDTENTLNWKKEQEATAITTILWSFKKSALFVYWLSLVSVNRSNFTYIRVMCDSLLLTISTFRLF